MPYTVQRKGKTHIHDIITDAWVIYKRSCYNLGWRTCLFQAMKEHRELLVYPYGDMAGPKQEQVLQPKVVQPEPETEQQNDDPVAWQDQQMIGGNGELWFGAYAGYDV